MLAAHTQKHDNNLICTDKQFLDLYVLCCRVYTPVSVEGLSESAEMYKTHVRILDTHQGAKCKSGSEMQHLHTAVFTHVASHLNFAIWLHPALLALPHRLLLILREKPKALHVFFIIGRGYLPPALGQILSFLLPQRG